ncbi:MAG: TfoX/Sxy family protein [Coriobacteriales bacterium]
MPSSADYLEYVVDLLRDVPELSSRKMMGEYLLYSQGVLFGGVYDDRLLLKDVPAARERFSQEELPYEGVKPMLLADSEDPALLAELIAAMLPQLPKPKKRTR